MRLSVRLSRTVGLFVLSVCLHGVFSGWLQADLSLERLSEKHIGQVQRILAALQPMIQSREAAESLATLSFEELYTPLSQEDREFVRWFQHFDPVQAGINTRWHGIADGLVKLTAVSGQKVRKGGQAFVIPTQYVPPKVFKAYQRMMSAMNKDLGKRLYIESAYRSSAYQLYLFLFFLQNHDYSIRETAHWNAFPGYSEHGNPEQQALDFMNEEGITGEGDPEEFARLPEYAWLLEHGPSYGFELSFPKQDVQGIGFEPWHWRYVGRKAQRRGVTDGN